MCFYKSLPLGFPYPIKHVAESLRPYLVGIVGRRLLTRRRRSPVKVFGHRHRRRRRPHGAALVSVIVLRSGSSQGRSPAGRIPSGPVLLLRVVILRRVG